MDRSDDLNHMLRRLVPDDVTEELLRPSTSGPSGSGFAEVDELTTLIAAARRPGSVEELVGADRVAAAMAVAVRATHTTQNSGRTPMLARLTGKTAVIATAALVLSAGAAAAATGHLPDPVQRTVSHSLSHVGIDVPRPAPAGSVTDLALDGAPGPADVVVEESTTTTAELRLEATTTTMDDGSTTTSTTTDDSRDDAAAPREAGSQGVGPDANGPAHHGLCEAHTHSKPGTRSVAMANLEAAALAAGQPVDVFCAEALTPRGTDAGSRGRGNAPTTTDASSPAAPTTEAGPGQHGRGHGNSNGSGAAGGSAGAGDQGGAGNPSATAPGQEKHRDPATTVAS